MTFQQACGRTLWIGVLFGFLSQKTFSFVLKPSFQSIYSSFTLSQDSTSTTLHEHQNERESVDSDRELLNLRLHQMRIDLMEQEVSRPPNAALTAQEFIKQVLEGLQRPDDPLPESGFRLLLRASTPEWRREISRSIGAPLGTSEDLIASALGPAIARPKNQFGILVQADDATDFSVTFPSDPVDFDDGSCWLECRLYGKKDNELLVVMGWELKRRPLDGAWLIDGLDWQDFRDQYRPGIGREEWMRILG